MKKLAYMLAGIIQINLCQACFNGYVQNHQYEQIEQAHVQTIPDYIKPRRIKI